MDLKMDNLVPQDEMLTGPWQKLVLTQMLHLERVQDDYTLHLNDWMTNKGQLQLYVLEFVEQFSSIQILQLVKLLHTSTSQELILGVIIPNLNHVT